MFLDNNITPQNTMGSLTNTWDAKQNQLHLDR